MLARTPKQRLAKLHVVKRRADDVDRGVGTRIRARRIEQRLSQTELGDRCGVTFQQIQKYEKGTNRIGAGRLTRIAAALEIPAATLLGNEGAGETTLGDKLIPFAKLRDVQDNEPPVEQKCIDCRGEGVITVFSATTGLSLCTAICPTCRGTRYAP